MIFKKIIEKWANCLFSLISSFLVSDVNEALISLKSNERCEQIAQVAQQKWATMSNSLRSLGGNELLFGQKRAIRSEFKWANFQPWI